MADEANAKITLGVDKGYDAREFIEACGQMKITPYVSQNTPGQRSAMPDMIASISQQKRKLIE